MRSILMRFVAMLGLVLSTQPVFAAHSVVGDTEIHSGWHHSPWFGWFAEDSLSWIRHAEHGSIFPFGDPENLYWYDYNLGDWIWTSADVYPNVYKFTINPGWYWYNQGGAPLKRWFFQLATQQWMPEADLLHNNATRGWHLSEYHLTDPSYQNKESTLAGTTSILVDNLWFEGGRGEIQIHHTRHDKKTGDSIASRTYRTVWSDPPAIIPEGSRPSLQLEMELVGHSGGWSGIPQHSIYWNQGWGSYFIMDNGTKYFSSDMAARVELDKDVTPGSPGSTQTVQVNLGESYIATYTYIWHD